MSELFRAVEQVHQSGLNFMFHLPPYPGWDGLHPIVLHFPIVLLLVAPLLVVAGLVVPKHRHGFFLSALVLMVLGTVAAYIAVSTGEAAAQMADRTPEINRVLARHQAQADKVRFWFTVLTVVWLFIMAGFHFGRNKLAGWLNAVVPLLFLVCYLPAMLSLADMAHAGGRLVHQYGLHAMLPPER
ncbi:MAG: hypothetical protein NTZ16_05995 [Verrucomicrobia bacterium]|nr:hypothetical protein [Verrucomicrobiota bacterium]